MQKTLASQVMLTGVGLHSGCKSQLRVSPGEVNSGIVFVRSDQFDTQYLARFDNISDTMLNTTLGDTHKISTIEHLMAAFAGLGITNACVEVDAAEVPVFDGSSREIVEAFWNVGVVDQNVPAHIFEVVKPIRFTDDSGAYAELKPYSGYKISFEIDFEGTAIGNQSAEFEIENGVFVRELANCRTFCRREEVEKLQNQGLALGGSLNNAVVVDGFDVLNPNGLRREDEAVRHKILDAIGDLYLVGGLLRGHYHGHKAGHRITNELLRKAMRVGAIIKRDTQPSEFSHLLGFDVVSADFQH